MDLMLSTVLLAAAIASAQDAVTRYLQAIVHLFHDMRLEEAAAAAEDFTRRHPGHPAGPFYRSIYHYELYLFENPRRARTKDAFIAANAGAIAAAKAWAPGDPAVSAYYLAAGHGFRARILAHEKRYREAVAEARQALSEARRGVELNSGLDDLYLCLGMANYFLARVPRWLYPFVAFFVGRTEGREVGLSQIERAASKGLAARDEARAVLSAIYSSEGEGRWDKADAYLADLALRYPGNPAYRLRRAYVALRVGRPREAERLADCGGAWLKTLDPRVARTASAVACYRAAEARLFLEQPGEAQLLLDLSEAARPPAGLADWLRLRRANVLQARGRHDAARALLENLADKGAARQAAEFLRSPYPRGPRRAAPLRWPPTETAHVQ